MKKHIVCLGDSNTHGYCADPADCADGGIRFTQEIAIDSNQAVFSFIGTIQEETHRFAITFHRQLRSKRLRYSELDGIEGLGPKRKEQLLKHFKSLTAIGQASLPELERLLPKDAASAVYHHFHDQEE